jgi:phage baseplate assembly protein W
MNNEILKRRRLSIGKIVNTSVRIWESYVTVQQITWKQSSRYQHIV